MSAGAPRPGAAGPGSAHLPAVREALLAAAASALLFFAGLLLLPIPPATWLVAATPLIVLAARRGAATAAAAAAFAAACLLAAGIPLGGVGLFLAEHGLTGAWLGLRLARGRGLFRSVLLAAALLASAEVGLTALWARGAGPAPADALEEQINQVVASLEAARDRAPAVVLPSPGEVRGFVTTLWRFHPSLSLVFFLLLFSSNTLLAVRFLARAHTPGVRVPDLAGFRLPEWLVWPFIASLALGLAPVPLAATVGLNIAIPLALLHLLQGLAVLLHLGTVARVPRLGSLLFAVSLLLVPYLLVIPFLLGILDFRFDFRRRFAAPPPAAGG